MPPAGRYATSLTLVREEGLPTLCQVWAVVSCCGERDRRRRAGVLTGVRRAITQHGHENPQHAVGDTAAGATMRVPARAQRGVDLLRRGIAWRTHAGGMIERGAQPPITRVAHHLGRFKMAKHFTCTITETAFRYARDEANITQEAALDGIYNIRTSVPATERAFRTLKSVDLEVRPIFHRTDDRIRAHVLLCMLAYYVVWHMQRSLAPLLFVDEDPQAGTARRDSIVAPSERSEAADRKAARKPNSDGVPVHSFRTLLKDLATLVKNRIRFGESRFDRFTTPTPLQQRAFDLLGVQP